MAKMFYTLDEAASKLGVSEQEIKDMAASGRLQQFRDREKLMFKREQIDEIASSGESASVSNTGTVIPLADTSDSSGIDMKGDSDATSMGASMADVSDSGISVFDASEVDAADPAARTQVSGSVEDDEELALESVGSGSGLLDLTREADDTSLGAELLDEIYPGSDTAAGSGASAVGSSGVFEGELGDSGTVGTGVEQLGGTATGVSAPMPTAVMPVAAYGQETIDGAGSGMSSGLLIATIVSLIIAMTAVISAVGGIHSSLVQWMTTSGGQISDGMFYGWIGGLFALALVLMFIGMFIGKSSRA